MCVCLCCAYVCLRDVVCTVCGVLCDRCVLVCVLCLLHVLSGESLCVFVMCLFDCYVLIACDWLCCWVMFCLMIIVVRNVICIVRC